MDFHKNTKAVWVTVKNSTHYLLVCIMGQIKEYILTFFNIAI